MIARMLLSIVSLLGYLAIVSSSTVSYQDVINCPTGNWKCCHILRTDSFPNLNLQYTCNSNNVTIQAHESYNSSSHFRLFLSDSCLSSFPSNLCDFPNIVSIRFRRTQIRHIPRLSCLKNLIALRVMYSEIEEIRNNTFKGLAKLRVLDLRGNNIKRIGVGTFTADLHGLMLVFLNYNKLETADASWPLSIRHKFCYFGTSDNRISRFTNERKEMIDFSKNYGPGFWDLSNNNFTVWLVDQLKIYGITDMFDLGAFFSWGFDLRGNPWQCDCKMHAFLKGASNLPKVMWRSYFSVKCFSPPALKGHLIINLPLESFACNLSKKCPENCFCQDQPEHKHTLVDCRNNNLTALPDQLPPGHLKILLGGNSIKSLDARPYINRTVFLDLSRNGLTYVSQKAITMLQKTVEFINLEDNAMTHLPDVIQNIAFSKLSFRGNPLICDCKSAWMSQWLKQQDRKKVSNLTCSFDKSDNEETIIKADSVFLQCNNNPYPRVLSVLLGLSSVIFVTIIVIVIIFRYEMALLARMWLQTLRGNLEQDFEYDMFVSLDEDDSVDLFWAVRTLLPELETKKDLRLYLPPRDMDPGTVRVEEIIKALKKCRTALVLFSGSYSNNPSKLFEFSEAFKIMVQQRGGQVFIVKAKEITSSCNGCINAYIRLSKYFDRDDRELFDKLYRKCHAYVSAR